MLLLWEAKQTQLSAFADRSFVRSFVRSLARFIFNVSTSGCSYSTVTPCCRYGLGFCSVFHMTDLPSFVSGEHLVVLDPHANYLPGGVSESFTKGGGGLR